MELELSNRGYTFYDTAARLSASREQTQEQVVPDARPDVLRIVAAYGSVLATDRSLRDGRAEVGGVVRAAVLYLPESGEGLEYINITIPFSQTFDLQCGADDVMFCTAELESIDARTINPRKILARANVRVGVRILRRHEAQLPYEVASPGSLGVRTLSETRRAKVAIAATAKQFTVTDTLELSGAPAIAEIVSTKVTLKAGDYNIIGRRIVFKATASVELMYRANGGNICTYRSDLPFSQILEPEDACDDAAVTIRLRLCDLSSALRQEDGGRSFELTFTGEAQAVVYADREFEAVADLYSTSHKASVECVALGLESLVSSSERRMTVRLSLETPVMPRDAEDAEVYLSPVTIERGADCAAVCDADVCVRYTGEDGAQYQAHGKSPVRIELDDDAVCELHVENLTYSAAAAGGVDVRFDAVADVECIRTEAVGYVASATLEEYDDDAPARPSVVLRYPLDGESMWQVAKRYCTTEQDIREANGLGDDELPAPDKLMLIPRRR